jgi:phage gpG-like protein
MRLIAIMKQMLLRGAQLARRVTVSLFVVLEKTLQSTESPQVKKYPYVNVRPLNLLNLLNHRLPESLTTESALRFS